MSTTRLEAAGPVRAEPDPAQRPLHHGSGGLRGEIPGDRGRPLRPLAPRDDLGPATTGGPVEAAGALPLRGQRTPGAGGADGDALGPTGGRRGLCGPAFDVPLETGGYQWWYLDVVSDDGDHALTVIFFLGGVFSPRYYDARRSGPVDPAHFPTVNAVLYGPRGAWAYRDGSAASVTRSDSALGIGASSLRWEQGTLVATLDEPVVRFPNPFPRTRRLSGTVRLTPTVLSGECHTLSDEGHHRWWPVAPVARAEVVLDSPELRFSGHAYHDANAGAEGLEEGFVRWHWLRASDETGTSVVYEAERRRGGSVALGRRYGADGHHAALPHTGTAALSTGTWGVRRPVPADPAGAPRRVRTLEDTPFYTRSLVDLHLAGVPARAVHESLDLDRFDAGWVRFLLPYRIRRAP